MKSGSKQRSRVAASIPVPLSDTEIATQCGWAPSGAFLVPTRTATKVPGGLTTSVPTSAIEVTSPHDKATGIIMPMRPIGA